MAVFGGGPMSRTMNQVRRISSAGDLSWRPAATSTYVPTEPEPAPETDLRHGLTLDDLARAAAIALRINGHMAGDPSERYDIAWCGAAEHLYESDGPMSRDDLVRAASGAINEWIRSVISCHGVSRRRGGETGSAPRFAAYWTPTPGLSLEERAVESVALGQIWPRLAPGQRRAITALAAHGGDVAAAASAMGTSRKNFQTHLNTGRRLFRQLWHEGEKPSGHWSFDRDDLRGENTPEGYKLVQQIRAERRRRTARASEQSADLTRPNPGAES
jgi:hypothetical protein